MESCPSALPLKPTVSQRPESGYSGREEGKQERMPFAKLRSAMKERQWFPKSRNPFTPCEIPTGTPTRDACKRMATAGNGTAGRKPTSRETTWAV